VAGVTTLSNGQIVLILDMKELARIRLISGDVADRRRRCAVPALAVLRQAENEQGRGQAGRQGDGGQPRGQGAYPQLQREAARKRMMGAVPTADVIVTNPTHFAVALAYKSGMGAPKVLAKGMGEIALKIRAIGAENGVPMLEAPPLARALYRHAELDQEIPSTLYAAVAEVLAYVYQLTNWRQVGGVSAAAARNRRSRRVGREAVNG
jgi:type III secretion system FlhB-like substrate exporter